MQVITNVQGNPNALFIKTDDGTLIETTEATMMQDMARLETAQAA